MPNPSHPDWIDALLDEAQGFSLSAMVKTVGHMISGADRVALQIALKTHNEYVDAKEISTLATALKNISQAIQGYASIYTWCEQYGQTGADQRNSLQDLVKLLDGDELKILHGWMKRLPLYLESIT
jgi:hypothetical protein